MEEVSVNSQMVKKMKELLNGSYTTMQNMTIQATAWNINAISYCLNNIQTVYNFLDSIPERTDNENGQISANE